MKRRFFFDLLLTGAIGASCTVGVLTGTLPVAQGINLLGLLLSVLAGFLSWRSYRTA